MNDSNIKNHHVKFVNYKKSDVEEESHKEIPLTTVISKGHDTTIIQPLCNKNLHQNLNEKEHENINSVTISNSIQEEEQQQQQQQSSSSLKQINKEVNEFTMTIHNDNFNRNNYVDDSDDTISVDNKLMSYVSSNKINSCSNGNSSIILQMDNSSSRVIPLQPSTIQVVDYSPYYQQQTSEPVHIIMSPQTLVLTGFENVNNY